MADSCAPEVAAKAKEEAQSRAKILEGVDFIETEEDAEAVESAVVKIQSTFRGKKIRSKLGQKAANSSQGQTEDKAPSADATTTTTTSATTKGQPPKEQRRLSKQEEELNKRVAEMEVNDNKDGSSNAMSSPQDEAERAATKIQAGFKGYKTRKELGGKLATGQPSTAAPSGADADNQEEPPQ